MGFTPESMSIRRAIIITSWAYRMHGYRVRSLLLMTRVTTNDGRFAGMIALGGTYTGLPPHLFRAQGLELGTHRGHT